MNNPSNSPQQILSPEEISKIRQQELLRMQLRQELTENKEGKFGIWQFLNSNFGLWLLSTVAVGFITWSYTKWKETKEARADRDYKISMLDAEITYRLNNVEQHLESASTLAQYEAAIHDIVGNPGIGAQQPASPGVTETYKNASTIGLIILLKSLVSRTEEKDLSNVLSSINKLNKVYRGSVVGTGGTRGEYYAQLQPQEEVRRKQILKIIADEVKIQRWQFN